MKNLNKCYKIYLFFMKTTPRCLKGRRWIEHIFTKECAQVLSMNYEWCEQREDIINQEMWLVESDVEDLHGDKSQATTNHHFPVSIDCLLEYQKKNLKSPKLHPQISYCVHNSKIFSLLSHVTIGHRTCSHLRNWNQRILTPFCFFLKPIYRFFLNQMN